MKKLGVLLIAATLALAAQEARAVDFKTKGNWQVGVGLSEKSFVKTVGNKNNDAADMDIWGLSVPVRLDGVEFTPWALYGIRGRNTFTGGKIWNDSNPMSTLGANPFDRGANSGNLVALQTGKTYGGMFWAGLPVGITAFDPLNIEFELNYGFVEAMERGVTPVRGSTQRQGWLAKALVEYKTNWGRPGVFGWYASGDDDNIKNGSERMPTLRPYGKFSSIMGDDVHYGGGLQDQKLTYTGTWGLGLQVRDVSFVKNLKHTLRALY